MIGANWLQEKLKSGKPVVGTWSTIPSPIVADILCQAGLDFLIIDAEHGPIGYETAQQMAAVCQGNLVSPVMRVGNIDESKILRALDIGVHCIQVPNVETASDVRRIVDFAKYPPIGNRGYSPFTRAGSYSAENAEIHTKLANDKTLIAINAEGTEILREIDEILEIDALDIVFIGLFDLSKALGIPGKVDDPEVQSLMRALTTKILKANKFPGTITTDISKIESYVSLGLKYIVHSVDCAVLKEAYGQPVTALRSVGKK